MNGRDRWSFQRTRRIRLQPRVGVGIFVGSCRQANAFRQLTSASPRPSYDGPDCRLAGGRARVRAGTDGASQVAGIRTAARLDRGPALGRVRTPVLLEAHALHVVAAMPRQ